MLIFATRALATFDILTCLARSIDKNCPSSGEIPGEVILQLVPNLKELRA